MANTQQLLEASQRIVAIKAEVFDVLARQDLFRMEIAKLDEHKQKLLGQLRELHEKAEPVAPACADCTTCEPGECKKPGATKKGK